MLILSTGSLGRTRMADRSIDKREQYVAFATHCLQLAKVAANRQSRDVLREMASEWLRLAEVAGPTDASQGSVGRTRPQSRHSSRGFGRRRHARPSHPALCG